MLPFLHPLDNVKRGQISGATEILPSFTLSVKMVQQYHQVIPEKCHKKIKHILKRNNSREISFSAF